MPRRNQTAQQSEADAHWAIADEYAAVANDPSADPGQRAYAQSIYNNAVREAQQAEAAQEGSQ